MNIRWNGNKYESYAEAARDNGHSRRSIWRWINIYRYRGDSDVIEARNRRKRRADDNKADSNYNRPQPVTWDGVKYPSINAAAKATNRHSGAMLKLIRKGYKRESDLQRKRERNSFYP